MLDSYLVDTGVFARWYVEQPGFEHALEVQSGFLAGEIALETVDLTRVELANALRKTGLRDGRLSRVAYLAAVRDLDDLGVVVHGTTIETAVAAAALAADRSMSVHDAVFVHRAIERDLPLLTSDKRLVHAARGLLPTELLRGVDGR